MRECFGKSLSAEVLDSNYDAFWPLRARNGKRFRKVYVPGEDLADCFQLECGRCPSS